MTVSKIQLRAALACTALTAAVVLARGFARPRRLVVHHGVLRVHPAVDTWTAISRSLGIAGLVLLAATLPVGLMYGRRLVSTERRAEVRALHMTLSLSALTAIGLHIITLLGASRLGTTVVKLVLPFAWHYRQTATAYGVLSAYVLAVLGPTYFARRRVGFGRWRIAHRAIAAGLVLSILHVIGGG